MKLTRKLYVSLVVGVVSALAIFVGNAAAAADATITDAKTQLTTYFTDNLPTVIAAFVAVAMAIWALHLLFNSTGVKKPTKVG
jgi:hypothetical protein